MDVTLFRFVLLVTIKTNYFFKVKRMIKLLLEKRLSVSIVKKIKNSWIVVQKRSKFIRLLLLRKSRNNVAYSYHNPWRPEEKKKKSAVIFKSFILFIIYDDKYILMKYE